MAEEDDEAVGALSAQLEQTAGSTRKLEASAIGFARAMTQAFRSAVVGGKRFEDVLKGLALKLSDLSLKMALKPLEKGLASGIDSLFKSLSSGLGGLTLFGGVAPNTKNEIAPFAAGGVIATPAYFPLGAGGTGLMGEAGPEAILPLARTSDGRLGVAASGGGPPAATVSITIATPDPDGFRRSEAYVTGLIARAVARGQRGL
jgi:phage-related minor tail protein